MLKREVQDLLAQLKVALDQIHNMFVGLATMRYLLDVET